MNKMKWHPNTYRVELHCASNNLNAMVEVVSISEAHAGHFAQREFFRGRGWKVTKVKRVG